MEETISISIFNAIKKRWKLIVLLTFVVALTSGTISYFSSPVYRAYTQILVNQKSGNYQFDVNQLKANVDVINTYSVIIKSPAILDKVKENLDFKESIGQLNQKITVNSQENSQVFSLIVEDSDRAKAVEIANTVSETFQKEIPNIMNIDNVSILAKAESSTPVKANSFVIMAIAVVVGLMAGMGLAFLLEYMNNMKQKEGRKEVAS